MLALAAFLSQIIKMKIKLSLKSIRKTVSLLILLGLAGFIGFRIGNTKTSALPNTKVDLSTFWLVWNRLEEKYLEKDDLDPEKMVEGAISGMVESLDDPYTVFLSPEDNRISEQDLSGEFGGVGIQLGFKDKTLAVISPLSGTPAEAAGVKSGDLILNIKDELTGVDRATDDVSLPEAVQLIRGRPGTVVTLTLFRDGQDAPFDVDIERGTIVVPATESKWIDQNGKTFAYIHLLQFTEQVNQEWLKWAAEVSARKNSDRFAGVILDLRGNPGGYLQGAVFVAGDFLPKGKTVVWQEDYRGRKGRFAVSRQGSLLDAPLVVLVDKGSASASEILAGALKDYNRATIVGQTTFGKGIIQEPEQLPDGAGLHITTARWLLPNQGSIHKVGIEPDIVVDPNQEVEEGVDPILQKAIEILTSN